MKKKIKKITTINELAVMMNNNFQSVQDQMGVGFNKIDGRFDRVDGRLMKLEIRMDNLEAEVEEIRKHQIAHTIYRDEFEKLQNGVKTLEKLLVAKG